VQWAWVAIELRGQGQAHASASLQPVYIGFRKRLDFTAVEAAVVRVPGTTACGCRRHHESDKGEGTHGLES
jgi:hypothetical protein